MTRSWDDCRAVAFRFSSPSIGCPSMPVNGCRSATVSRSQPSRSCPNRPVLPAPAMLIPAPRMVKSVTSAALPSGILVAASDQSRSRPSSRGAPSGLAIPRMLPPAVISMSADGSAGLPRHPMSTRASACSASAAATPIESPVASIRSIGRSSLPEIVAISSAEPRTGWPSRPLADPNCARLAWRCPAMARWGPANARSAFNRPAAMSTDSVSSEIAPFSEKRARAVTGTLSPVNIAISGGSSGAIAAVAVTATIVSRAAVIVTLPASLAS